MESNKVESKMNIPCSKKGKEGNFFDNLKSQFDVFMNTSMEQHRICLQRSFNDFRDFVKHKREELVLVKLFNLIYILLCFCFCFDSLMV